MKKTQSDNLLHGSDASEYSQTNTEQGGLASLLLGTLRQANRPLRMDELLRITRLPRKKKRSIESTLYDLQEEGKILRSSSGWSLPDKLKHIEGILSVQQAGMGFVTPLQGGRDVFIHPSALNSAWHGDTVEVLVLPGRKGPSAEGRIVRVIHRSQKEIAAYALKKQQDGRWLCTPANSRIPALFSLRPAEQASGAGESPSSKAVTKGDLLLLHPLEETAPNIWEAELVANLEREDSPQTQERIAKSNHQIPAAFPPAVISAAERLPADPSEDDFAHREDLRAIPFVTIDGKTARDFDDAIHVTEEESGFHLHVAIADVAHYVRQGSALDTEALLRGNSYYFPLSVEPMLPEALSNGLCSLRPFVPRLVMVADMFFTKQGEQKKATFYPAVIVSQGRLTYGQIQRALLLEEPEERANLEQHLPMLEQARRFAEARRKRRTTRGSLDFDMPEAQYLFSESGEIEGVTAREHHFGHKIIEECMVAANEAVARFLEEHGQPCLYRVHEAPDPDKMSSLMNFLVHSGLAADLPKNKNRKITTLSGKDLRRIMDSVRGTPQEYIVTRLTLRSMMQARYQPDNEGHFGLASDCYCHFTSPIRRYADLVVHRSLKSFLGKQAAGGEKPLTRSRLEGVAKHINMTERSAAEAEREVQKRLSVLFMRQHVGETFTGTVSGVMDFGFFVEIREHMCEGMVRLSALGDDFYEFIQERQELRGRGTNRVFRLGQSVKVEITDVSTARLEINLALAEDSEKEIAKGRPYRFPEPRRSSAKKKPAPKKAAPRKAKRKKR